MNQTCRPVVLCILDGWGYREASADNAITAAHTPTWDRLWREWPHTLLQASEHYVGLPEGQMGNSEVGHANLGAGRVIYQDLPRIDHAIKTESLKTNPNLALLIRELKQSKGRCHLLGLVSPGGVHSHQNHILALVKILDAAQIPVVLHAFLDGRDTPPQSALAYMQDFLEAIKPYPRVEFGTIGGRYYAMDRDKRWDRVEKAYEAMVSAQGEQAALPLEAIERSYQNDITDEFMLPTVIGEYQGMYDGDGLLVANFRSDRVRQILEALMLADFNDFERKKVINFAVKTGMIEYSNTLNRELSCLFPLLKMQDVLGEIISRCGGKQLRIAETEKYPHVTFFFNGGREAPFPGEYRILVPSPLVSTYDQQPEMSAVEVTDRLIEALNKTDYDLVVVNYANTDMVGHTGDQKAAQKAVEAVDQCLGRLEDAVLAKGGTLMITADHGNAEMMFDSETHAIHTAHTCNPVPFVLVSKAYKNAQLHEGKLADVAPTILKILDLEGEATAMTGVSLLEE